ncbi:MAG: helix-turn-helix domain-containing protein [Pseudomonadota bacterium]
MNIATALKSEISRVSRKEAKSQTQQLKKASAQYRSDIAALKRRVAELEKLVARLARGQGKKVAVSAVDDSAAKVRFSAKGLATQRKRLALSAADMGKLLGVSGASIYLWEEGKTRPRANMLPAIAALRKMGKKAATEKLAG